MVFSLDIGLWIKNLIPLPLNIMLSDGKNKYEKKI